MRRMNTRKTVIRLFIAVLLAAVLLTGCSRGKMDSKRAAEEITVTFMNQSETLGAVKVSSGTVLDKASYKDFEELEGAAFYGWYETPTFIETSRKDLEKDTFSKDTTLYGNFKMSEVSEDTRKWYIAGTSEKGSLKLNNWATDLSDDEKAQFELEATGNQANEFSITIDLFSGDEFQIISDWSWENQLGYGKFTGLDDTQMINAGGLGGTDDTSNVKVVMDGKYTITLVTNPDNPAQNQISAVRSSDVY